MSVKALQIKAREHWTEWLPILTAELKEQGAFNHQTLKAAEQAQAEIYSLMSQGYQEHEAEEVVLQQYILLQPEVIDDEDARELAEMEEEYQREMVPLLVYPDE